MISIGNLCFGREVVIAVCFCFDDEYILGGGNDRNNNKSGGQRGLEKCASSFSVFVTQGSELRMPMTLRVVGNVLKT